MLGSISPYDCNYGSVDIGQTIYCTMTNTDQPAHITVIKNVVNNYGGTAVPGDFTMNVMNSANPAPFPGSGSGTTIQINSGSFAVTESVGPSGYTLAYSGNCNGTVASGGSKTCTLTNTALPVNIIVIKHVVNGVNGGATASSFTMNVMNSANPAPFPGSESGVKVNLNAGAFAVTESGPSGYALSYSGACNGTITNGQSDTCTLTNVEQGTIVIVKDTVGADGTFQFSSTGGSNMPGSFSVSTDGYTGSQTYTNIAPGTYSVSETVPTGWQQESAVCTGDSTPSHIIIPVGGTVTCTFTDEAQGTLEVVKNVVGADGTFAFTGTGGSTVPGLFSISTTEGAGSTTFSNVNPDNTYTLAETVPTGYQLESASCTGGVIPGASNAITVGAGKTVICTFNDVQQGKLVVVKSVVGADGTFAFTSTGDSAVPGSFSEVTSEGSNTITFSNVNPDGTYSLAESVPTGYQLESSSCGGDNTPGSITLSAGQTVTCTFNDVQQGKLVIVKNVVGADGTFAFTGTGGSTVPGLFSISTTEGAGSTTFSNVNPDNTYTLAETVPTGYQLESASCTGGVIPGASNAITVGAGKTVICTFNDVQQHHNSDKEHCWR